MKRPKRVGHASPVYTLSPDQYVKDLRLASRHSTGSRIARAVVVVLALTFLGILSYVGYIVYNVARISTNSFDLSSLSSDSDGRVNLLVLGEGDPGHAGTGLTDTIMVLSLDTRTRHAAQISVPRDLRVDIPGYGRGKINVANAVGGAGLAEQVVANTLGIPIHYYAKTDFSGLTRVVDAVGGLDINVKERLYDPEYPCLDNQYKACGLDIQPGLQHMNGEKVLEYARCRKGTCGNDFGRAERQQEVLAILKSKIVAWPVLLDPGRMAPIVQAFSGGVKTDMSSIQMAEFGWAWQQAVHNDSAQVVLSTDTGGLLMDDPYSSDLLPADGTFGAIQEKTRSIFGH